MAYDHYLEHQPKRNTNIVIWILLLTVASFLVGIFVGGQKLPASLASWLAIGSIHENVTRKAAPGSSYPTDSDQLLW
jgi:hypothetical protein